MLQRLYTYLLTILGITACDSIIDPVCLYGMPYNTFEINGTVKDADGKPMEGAQVILRSIDHYQGHMYEFPYSGAGSQYNNDTLTTDKDGKYSFYSKKDDANTNLTVMGYGRIVVNDLTGKHESDSDRVDIKPTKKGDGDWYQGHYVGERDFQLKSKPESDDDAPDNTVIIQ